MIRINRFIALCGISSRRAAEALIKAGRVKVNGRVTTELTTRIDEQKDRVMVDGKLLRMPQKNIYVLLNKPKGYVTTADDEKGRKTVLDLIDVPVRIVPVGRLDYQSEGLLLLTNDGDMVHRLLHPRFKVDKTYYVTLKSEFDAKDFDRLTGGVDLEEFVTAPCEAWYYGNTADRVALRIHEGKKHQIRRMLAALGYEVKNLKRVQFGPLHLNKLHSGEWRYLETAELRQLKNLVKTVAEN